MCPVCTVLLPDQRGLCNVSCVYCIMLPVQGVFVMCCV